MTEKKKNGVQTAEKSTEKPSDVEAVSETQTTVPFDISKVDPEKIKMAEEFGIPVVELAQWAETVEARLVAIQEKMPQQIKTAMNEAIKEAQQRQVEAMKNLPTGAGGGDKVGLGQIIGLLSGGGGGGMDEEMVRLNKDILRESLTAMRRRSDLTEKLVDAIVTRVASKAAGDITEAAGV